MRILSLAMGLLVLVGLVYSGYYANENPSFVVWFGVITAVASPLAFELILFPFKSKDKEILVALAKVPDIEKLIKEARDNEERVKLLEKQKASLATLIAFEAKRRTLEAEKEIFIIQGQQAIRSIEDVNMKLELLTKEKQVLHALLNESKKTTKLSKIGTMKV
jgi:hypothetical protein